MKFISGTFALLIGLALYKQFDFETYKFENTTLAIVYLIGFAISIYFLIQNFKKRSDK